MKRNSLEMDSVFDPLFTSWSTIGLQLLGLKLDFIDLEDGVALGTGMDVTNYDGLLCDDLRGTGTRGLSEFDLEGVLLEMDLGFGDASSTY